MILYDPKGKVKITHELGQYVARGAGCIGYGKSPRAALLDWRAATKFLDSFCDTLERSGVNV